MTLENISITHIKSKEKLIEMSTLFNSKEKDMTSFSWEQPEKMSSDSDIFDDGTFPITMENVFAASKRIESHIVNTDCKKSKKLSSLTGVNIFLKCEYRQSTGSFKERGAINAILRLNSSKRKKGIIAASAGNHALALAFHGKRLKIPVTVVMPRMAPLTKKKRCDEFGANVIIYGDSFDKATEYAIRYGEENEMTYIHGFDDQNVIAGQGSIGLEILKEVPNVDAIIVPVGGGGMMAGILMAIKSENPKVEVIGVEPHSFACCSEALSVGKPVEIEDKGSTIADGLAVKKIGKNCFPIIQKLVDRMLKIDERWTALSVLRVMELEKTILEGAGAIALAPFLANMLPEYENKNVVLLFCGGNIDMNVVGRVIDYGLVADGRLARFSVIISDRPGGLAHLCKIIGDAGASMKEVQHHRTFTSAVTAFTETYVEVTVETRDANHLEELKMILTKNKVNFEIHNFQFHEED